MHIHERLSAPTRYCSFPHFGAAFSKHGGTQKTLEVFRILESDATTAVASVHSELLHGMQTQCTPLNAGTHDPSVCTSHQHVYPLCFFRVNNRFPVLSYRLFRQGEVTCAAIASIYYYRFQTRIQTTIHPLNIHAPRGYVYTHLEIIFAGRIVS